MKINLLPRAEWLSLDEQFSQETVYTRKSVGIKTPTWVFFVLFVLMLIFAFINIIILLFIFGATFVLAGLSNTGKLRSNGVTVKNTMWNRLPLLLAGICVIFFGIAVFFEKKDDKQGDIVFFSLAKLFIAVVGLIAAGRLIYLIATSIAISARKKRCTEAVFAEPAGFTTDSDHNSEDSTNLGDRDYIFIYHFEGNNYRLIADSFTRNIDGLSSFELYVDPEQPELYYSKQLFSYNRRKISSFFKTLLFWLLFTAVLWVPMLVKWYIDKTTI